MSTSTTDFQVLQGIGINGGFTCNEMELEQNETKINDKGIEIKLKHVDNDKKNSFWVENIDIPKHKIDISPHIPYKENPIFWKGTLGPNPCYFDGKIITALCAVENDPGIHCYDIHTQKSLKLASYPDDVDTNGQEIALDEATQILYSVAGASGCFTTFDLFTKSFTIVENFDIPKIEYGIIEYSQKRKMIYYEGEEETNDSDEKLFIYEIDVTKKTIQRISDTLPEIARKMDSTTLLYDEDGDRLWVLGGMILVDEKQQRLDCIWIYDCIERKWMESTVKLTSCEIMHAMIGFESIIFAIYCSDDYNEIWCLEMNSMKWYKSEYTFPRELALCDVVVTDGHFVHWMDYVNIHARFSLYDAVPQELFEHYKVLISGFVRKRFTQDFARELIVLICKFHTSLY